MGGMKSNEKLDGGERSQFYINDNKTLTLV